MKNIITSILICISSTIWSQGLPANFEGTLILKETDYHFPISRDISDTFTSYYIFEIDNNVNISQFVRLGDDDLDLNYVPFNLEKHSDSLFLTYYNSISKQFVSQYQYPLNYRDTIDTKSNYKLIIDSIWQDSPTIVSIDCSFSYENSFLGDTVINFENQLIKCHKIQRYRNHLMNGKEKRILFISCESLIPIYEATYYYFYSPPITNIKRNQWVLLKELKLISTKNR